jgi:hypothetical protein
MVGAAHTLPGPGVHEIDDAGVSALIAKHLQMCELCAAYSDLFSPEHTSSLKAFLNYQSPQWMADFSRDMLAFLLST